jgi:hypothetical protein
VVASYAFEDGAVPYSFAALNGATVSVDPAAARSGSQGLKVTGLTANAGLSFSFPSDAPGNYHFTAWVRFASGEPAQQVIFNLRDKTAVGTANGSSFTAIDGYVSPETYPVNGCAGTVYFGRSFTATLKLLGQSCGSAPASTTAYIDDISIVYGSTASTAPTTTSAAACPPPTTTTTTTSTTTTTTTTSTTGTASCRVQYTLAGSWPGGWQSQVTLTNIGTQSLTNWLLEWTFAQPGTISQLWSATYTQVGNKVSVRPPSWSPTLRPNESITFGYLGSGTPAQPTDFRLNGSPCVTA